MKWHIYFAEIFTNFTDIQEKNKKQKEAAEKAQVEATGNETEDAETAQNVKAAFAKLAKKHEPPKTEEQLKSYSDVQKSNELQENKLNQKSGESITTGKDNIEKDSNESAADTPSTKKSGCIFYLSIFSFHN